MIQDASLIKAHLIRFRRSFRFVNYVNKLLRPKEKKLNHIRLFKVDDERNVTIQSVIKNNFMA